VEASSWEPASTFEKGQVVVVREPPRAGQPRRESLLFRIVEKSYLLGDDNPSRIRISPVEGES
jgi:hypothetical protein